MNTIASLNDTWLKVPLKKLPLALNLAFETLPYVIGKLPDVKSILRQPVRVIRILITHAEDRLSELKHLPEKQEAKRPFWPNLLLIAGSGRNTGKTSFACDIINYLSKSVDIIAVKISPHIHFIDDASNLLVKKQGLIITEEFKLNRKDSSRMKQAGAAHSFYVQAVDEKIPELLQWLKSKWPKGLFICESGGMIDHIKPGLFFFLKTDPIPEGKKRFLGLAPILVNYTDGHSDFDIKKIVIENGTFMLSPNY